MFTDVRNTNCPQKANCITVGHLVVVNNCRVSYPVRHLIPGFFANKRPPHIKRNAAYHCLIHGYMLSTEHLIHYLPHDYLAVAHSTGTIYSNNLVQNHNPFSFYCIHISMLLLLLHTSGPRIKKKTSSNSYNKHT